MYRIFLNFAKSCVLSCLSIVDNIKNIHRAVFELQAPTAVIKGVFSKLFCCYGNLLCHGIVPTSSPVVGQFFDTMIVASSDKEWL